MYYTFFLQLTTILKLQSTVVSNSYPGRNPIKQDAAFFYSRTIKYRHLSILSISFFLFCSVLLS